MRRARHAAFDRFVATGPPSDRAEDWRYSRIDDLDLERYQPVIGPSGHGLPDGVQRLVAALGRSATCVIVRDGVEVAVTGGHPSVTVTRIDAEDGPEGLPGLGSVAGEPDALVSLNAALAAAPLAVQIAPRAVVAEPVIVVHWVDADRSATFPRLVIDVGDGAQAVVAEVVASDDVDSLVVPVSEVVVGDGANLGHLQVQLLGSRAWQVGLAASRVGRDATYTAAAAAFGGDYARLRTHSALVGQGGSTRLLAAFLGAGHQMHDFRTVQDHRAPRGTSDLFYKGAVANRSQSVYSGLIRVEKGAKGTNAYQTNRNLVLHEGARADSVPNLEIEDNDVRCSHASAVGPIDADQRFYLESRGVPTDVAERLIAYGFVDEVLAQMPVPSVVPFLRQVLATRLDAAEESERSGVPA